MADVQQRALLPPTAALSTPSPQTNQDQSSDEDIFDDTDTDDENFRKQSQISNKKSYKSKIINRSINDESNNSAMQIKRLLSTIFPTTNDVYGFHLNEPSAESLQCYEQYARMARDACLPTSTPSSNKQHFNELSIQSYQSVSSNSSFEMLIHLFFLSSIC